MFNKELSVKFEKDFLRNKNVDDKVFLIMAYLMFNINLKGTIGTTLETIIKNIGYTPNKNKGRINDGVIQQLKWMEDNNIITIESEYDNITPKGYMQIKMNKHDDFLNIDTWDGDKNNSIKEHILKFKPFVILSEREYNKIVTADTTVNKGVLLRVFLNIKGYMNFSDDGDTKTCFPAQSTIAKNCNKTTGYTVNNAIKELVNMKILFVCNLGQYKDKNGHMKNINNVYAVDPEEFKGTNLESIKREVVDYYKKSKGVEIKLLET